MAQFRGWRRLGSRVRWINDGIRADVERNSSAKRWTPDLARGASGSWRHTSEISGFTQASGTNRQSALLSPAQAVKRSWGAQHMSNMSEMHASVAQTVDLSKKDMPSKPLTSALQNNIVEKEIRLQRHDRPILYSDRFSRHMMARLQCLSVRRCTRLAYQSKEFAPSLLRTTPPNIWRWCARVATEMWVQNTRRIPSRASSAEGQHPHLPTSWWLTFLDERDWRNAIFSEFSGGNPFALRTFLRCDLASEFPS
ncbi:hypothetical protein BU24DRAFT_477158 [Aaosphaeria arxii CBS 175.79]|uniref:Uncharacterized protein n=1 Tax=Aaosphaeria arxii CBS 175.79 TaxID=1450172 RepID=A0A6A5Y5K4_9PLEO|nr:uncharacterized protein BU24DRAFT_477158 [Aaosphaeria arxii CBS 175.79]KAF2020060.1 hypothetical protein BU24DRAFT_477158 [Aaosphaeria arxii CBS 175.79]